MVRLGGKDMLLKKKKYQNAGVREYWIIDPLYQKILVYDFIENAELSEAEDQERKTGQIKRTGSTGEEHPKTYGYDEKIPVLISGGNCTIDFSVVSEKIRRAF